MEITSSNCENILVQFKLKLYEQEQTRIIKAIADFQQQPKLRIYKLFKTEFRTELYLYSDLPKKLINVIARFRVSSHNLRIETGRYEKPKLPESERLCEKCNTGAVENEIHCLLICTKHCLFRQRLLSVAETVINNFKNMCIKDKFIAIMRCRNKDLALAVGNFLKNVFG